MKKTTKREAGGRVVETKPSRTNPLPCGCGAVGTPDMDTLGTKMEYRNIHVRLCPLHAAAPELYQALEGLVTEATEYFQTGNANALSFTAARAALAKARGEVSSTSNAVPPSPPPASSGLSKDKGGK